ncbi:hypothetical protein ACOSP7_002539 [Xanthoceras sorbifolium]
MAVGCVPLLLRGYLAENIEEEPLVSIRTMRCPKENRKGGSKNVQILPRMDITGESKVGSNSVIRISEVVHGAKVVTESDSLWWKPGFCLGYVTMVEAQVAADIRPAKQIEVVDEMGLIDCNIINGLDERSSFLLGENSVIDGLGESSRAFLGDSMVCVKSPSKPKTRRWKKIVRPVKKYPSPIQKMLTLRQNSRR